MRETPIVTLLSDFGLRDSYVAEMKGVILSICPQAEIVDISHEIRKFDVRMGAFILARAAPYFPKGTIHVSVVDPGVNTKRRPIVIEAKDNLYVGPDNGLLILSARKEGIRNIYEITNPRYTLNKISTTFHGRDVFSPAGAHLAKGSSPSDFGPPIIDPVTPGFAAPQIQGRKIRSKVIHIDDFGNLITNVTSKELGDIGFEGGNLLVRLRDKDLTLRFCSAYGEVPRNTPLVLIGSRGFLEFAVNQGSASQTFEVETGDEAILRAISR